MVNTFKNSNNGGCMKKKKPWHYVKQRAKVKNIKYEYVYVEDLEKLNKAAEKKNKNHYIPDQIMEYLKHHYKALIVKFKFLHNEIEWRLVLYGGDKYETLTLDVDDLNKVYIGYYQKKTKEAA